MPSTISGKTLWTQLRGCENGVRHYVDHLGNWIGRDYEKAGDPIPDVPQKLIDTILAPFPAPKSADSNIMICVPPWCWDYPVETASHMRKLAKRLEAIAEVMQIVAKNVPQSDDPIYISEIPGTFWASEGAHERDHSGH